MRGEGWGVDVGDDDMMTTAGDEGVDELQLEVAELESIPVNGEWSRLSWSLRADSLRNRLGEPGCNHVVC